MDDAEALVIGMATADPVGLASLDSGGKYLIPPHIERLNQLLLDVADGKIKRLRVSMPPRHGKSELISKYFVAWYIATHPDQRIILASYGSDFAASWGRKARNVLETWGPSVFGIEIAHDSSAADHWDIEDRSGGCVTAGVGSGITGRGCQILVIDDPVKDAAEAQSETIRETAWEWYRGTAYTRLEPDGAVIEIQTRWHEDDLAGKLEAEEKNDGDQWVKLVLPAIAEEDDPLGRQPGEALWPDRYPIERLKEIAKTLGSYLFAAEFQQHPQPAGGAIFKRKDFRYFEKDDQYYVLHKKNGDVRVPKRKCWIFQTVDPSGSSSEQADYFVVMTLAVTPDYELLVIDVDRQRVDTTSHRIIMGNNRTKHHPVYQAVENKTFGTNIIQALVKEGWPIRKLDAETDKVTRSRTVQARQEAEGVFFLAGAVWLEPLESELLKFPKDKHDDQVDCLSYAGIKISEEEHGELFSW